MFGPSRAPLLVLALLLGFFDHILHWGDGVLAAGLAIIVPIIGFRDSWSEAKFWITVFLLALLQVPLVVELSTLIERQTFPLMFAFGILDCVLVASVISWICSDKSTSTV